MHTQHCFLCLPPPAISSFLWKTLTLISPSTMLSTFHAASNANLGWLCWLLTGFSCMSLSTLQRVARDARLCVCVYCKTQVANMQLLEMAGMQKLVPSPQRTNSGGSRYGQYTPAALSNGSPPANGPPPLRRVSADRAQVTGPQPGGPSPMAQPVRWAALTKFPVWSMLMQVWAA